MFERYTVLQGPAGHETDWKRDKEQVDPDKNVVFCTIPALESSGAIDVKTIVYRFSPTFLDQPDKFYILLCSSKDGRVHAFQRITEARGDDLSGIYPSETIYFRSDYRWEPAVAHSA